MSPSECLGNLGLSTIQQQTVFPSVTVNKKLCEQVYILVYAK